MLLLFMLYTFVLFFFQDIRNETIQKGSDAVQTL